LPDGQGIANLNPGTGRKPMEQTIKVCIEDTTLRDGEQTPTVNLFSKEKIEIAHVLEEILTEDDTIDAGFPVAARLDKQTVEEICKTIKKPYILAICRLKEADIDLTCDALRHSKKGKVGLIIPTSDYHLKFKLNMSQHDLLQTVVRCIRHAKKHSQLVDVGFEDCTRTEIEFILRMTETVIAEGVNSIMIADTIGFMTPREFGGIFHHLKNRVPNIDKLNLLGAHCHNDMGLALANSIEAIHNGANYIGCAFNGLGERAGNTSTEELLMFFKLKSNVINNINSKYYRYDQIISCSNLVANYSGIAVQKTKPIVGEHCYLHESGIHQDGLIKDKTVYQLYEPSLVGYRGRMFSFGKYSGKRGLEYQLKVLGLDPEKVDMNRYTAVFKEFAESKKHISDEDLISIFNIMKIITPEISRTTQGQVPTI
jgi:2-isopropylmalate synthase